MCLFCFGEEKPPKEEMKGKYGEQYAAYYDFDNTYDITMCQAPCKEPACCLGSLLCFCPAQIKMRYKALNHVDPGSGWDNYKCCQGYFGGCLCLQPGKMGEDSAPAACMCLESCCCPGLAVSATSAIIRERYRLGLDKDDVRLIQCNNALQILACVVTCISMFTECEADDAVANVINCIAEVVFCSTSACMTAQVYHEIKIRETPSAPEKEVMERLIE